MLEHLMCVRRIKARVKPGQCVDIRHLETRPWPVLKGSELTCEGCGNRYDALRAGRCLDAPQLHLEPVPLLVGEDGLVKVALSVPA